MGCRKMINILLAETRLGLVQFDWMTVIFQLINTVLWVLIIYAIYAWVKKGKTKRNELEDRVSRLEREVEELKGKE